MLLGSQSRRLLATLIAAAALAGAWLAGAPLVAALLALAGGAAGVALWSHAPSPPIAAPAPIVDREPALPEIADLLRAVDDPMLIVREGRIVMANQAATTLLGSSIQGKDVRLALRHPAATGQLAAPEPANEPIELAGLGGPDRIWTMTVAALADGSRVAHLVDQSQARAVEQMRSDFIADASHELRTPLATLLGFLETLQDEEVSADAASRKRFIEIMFREATRMRRLIEDLITLSRVESQRFSVPTDIVPIDPLIEEVTADLAARISERGSSVSVENPFPGVAVIGDRAQLSQLLANLLGNACKYGRPGTLIRIEVEEAGDLIGLAVIDQGDGIAIEHIPRLTERFYRVDPGRSRSVGGTGLGLAIAKHIALRHRGRLEITSRLGEGSRVQVWVPRADPTSPTP